MDEPQNHVFKMSSEEKKLSLRLSGLFSIRMLGIFIILPIFSLYMGELTQSAFLAGLLFASYPLTQIILQPLFGVISDYFGRKPALIVGLALFTIGSLVLVFTSNIYVAILGRVIQGSGAISAVVLALATDLTREEIRTKVMAFIGISIGLTFGIAIVLSNIIYGLMKGTGIFLFCAILGVIGIYVAIAQIPNVDKKENDESTKKPKSSIRSLIKISFSDMNIVRLYLGTMLLHMLLTMTFFALPKYFTSIHISSIQTWVYYLPTFIISILVMFPLVAFAERFYKHRILFLFAIICLFLAYLLLILTEFKTIFVFWGILVFFIGFNTLEATQPSLMSRFAPEEYRGTVMGVFSSSQFLGTSIGSMLASLFVTYGSFSIVYYVSAVVSVGWFIIAWPMQNPVKKTANPS